MRLPQKTRGKIGRYLARAWVWKAAIAGAGLITGNVLLLAGFYAMAAARIWLGLRWLKIADKVHEQHARRVERALHRAFLKAVRE